VNDVSMSHGHRETDAGKAGDHDFDLVIVGGGLVGLSLVRALAGSDLRLALVEARPAVNQRGRAMPPALDPAAAGNPVSHQAGEDDAFAGAQPMLPGGGVHDERSTALSPSSRRIFQALGCWQPLAAEAAAIQQIHVSDQGGFGMTRIRASDEGLDALGHVVPNRVLGRVLGTGIRGQSNLTVFQPAEVERLEDQDSHVRLLLNTGGVSSTLDARLVVAADGTHSQLRQALAIRVWETDYGQVGIIANITPERHPAGLAFERFTAQGPLALLPLRDGHCSLVWTVHSDTADQLLGLSDADFLNALQQAFGFRLGRFLQIGSRSAWPLKLVQSRQRRRGRTVIVGNAARTLHPVAGQGFNLALRDVAELAEQIHNGVAAGEDPGSEAVLERYEAARVSDDRRVVSFTDGLVRLFSNRLPGIRLGRNLGLVAMELFPPGRRWLMRQAMGRGVRPSRLARGLPLVAPSSNRLENAGSGSPASASPTAINATKESADGC